MLEQAVEETSAAAHAGATAAGGVGDDVGLRESTVDSLAAAAEELPGCDGAMPPSSTAPEAAPGEAARGADADAPLHLKGRKYP